MQELFCIGRAYRCGLERWWSSMGRGSTTNDLCDTPGIPHRLERSFAQQNWSFLSFCCFSFLFEPQCSFSRVSFSSFGRHLGMSADSLAISPVQVVDMDVLQCGINDRKQQFLTKQLRMIKRHQPLQSNHHH